MRVNAFPRARWKPPSFTAGHRRDPTDPRPRPVSSPGRHRQQGRTDKRVIPFAGTCRGSIEASARARLRCLRRRVFHPRRRDAQRNEDRAGRRAQRADRERQRAAAHRVPRPDGGRDHRAPSQPAGRGRQPRGDQEHPDAAGGQRRRHRRARRAARRAERGGVRERRRGRGREEAQGREQAVPRARDQGWLPGRRAARRGERIGPRGPREPRGDAVQDRRVAEVRDVPRGRDVHRDAVEVPVAARGLQGEAAGRGARRGSAGRARSSSGTGSRSGSRARSRSGS